MLPSLPMHGGDRNRTSPFAFTGNKFEFRALGSSMSLALPNTVLNTIVAEAIDELTSAVEDREAKGDTLEEAVLEVVRAAYAAHKRIVFSGDNYSDEWHSEAEAARAREPAPVARSAAVAGRAEHRRGVLQVRRAVRARARVPLRGAPRAVRDDDQHRG